MFANLRHHPFGVEAFFRRSLVLAYAVPEAQLIDLIGPGLQLDTFEGYGFLAIALVETQGLRPAGLPAWLGRNFFLSGYRIFTKFPRPGRATLRGLRILRSDTDRSSMVALGNAFTHYGYRHAKVELMRAEPSRLELAVSTPEREADLVVSADLSRRPGPLPDSSPFRTLEEARRFAGPLPYTFSFDQATQKMVVVKGLRTSWDPMPVAVHVETASYLEDPRFAGARLANAFYLENVAYAWKPGTLESIP